ncbi:oligosaccharide flippase family protein [Pseudomonas bubulae]|uniref:oligosaccharide flippase family protein n=1 Tax=Pseudomonas bubulae TaxID=2316085 RepID=UPI00307D6460
MFSAIQLIKKMNYKPDHPLWVVSQQVIVRGLMALKFLIAARLLGPEQIGLVGIALLSLATVEAMTDTGMSQAIIQNQKRISPNEAGAAWTLQVLRGLILGISLIILSTPISIFFKLDESAQLIIIAAAIPVLRNSINPGYFLKQRDRNFKVVSFYESSAALLDFIISIIFIKLHFGAASILIGSIASETLKFTLSWTLVKIKIIPTTQWKSIKELTNFGRWVWGSSIITMILNQLDKVLVAKLLGTAEFGLYQVASKIAQLLISDAITALGQFLFPTFSKKFRHSFQEAKKYFSKTIIRIGFSVALIATLVSALSTNILSIALGEEWLAAAPVLRILSIGMFLGACITILVSFSRAVGKPQLVTQAVIIQLITLSISAPILINKFGSVGMALGSCFAMLSTVAYLTYRILKIKT